MNIRLLVLAGAGILAAAGIARSAAALARAATNIELVGYSGPSGARSGRA